jgi:uncharacterized protein (TIGR02246 family)
MKTYVALTLALALLPGAAAAAHDPRESSSSTTAKPSGTRDRIEIEALLKRYEQALNASDVAGVVQLYTDDAALLAPNAPSAVGIDAVRAAYTGIFHAIDLDLTFEIAEVNVVSHDWAVLRSTSNGSITILADGAEIPSSNQELFMLHKTDGHWKLARYSFSSVLPAA